MHRKIMTVFGNMLKGTALSGCFRCISKAHKTEAVAQRCSVKKVFLEISQNSQENTWARALIKSCLKDSGTGVFL